MNPDFIVFIYTDMDTSGLTQVHYDDRMRPLNCKTFEEADAQAVRFPNCNTIVYEKVKNSNGGNRVVDVGGAHFNLYTWASTTGGKNLKHSQMYQPLFYALKPVGDPVTTLFANHVGCPV